MTQTVFLSVSAGGEAAELFLVKEGAGDGNCTLDWRGWEIKAASGV